MIFAVHTCFIAILTWYFVVLYLALFVISITARNIQQVGYPLTLDCSIQKLSGITTPLEIVWITNTEILQRSNVTSNGSVYTNSYTIMQLTTALHGREIRCIANRTDPEVTVMDSNNIILNVTGKLNGNNFWNKSMHACQNYSVQMMCIWCFSKFTQFHVEW